MDTLNSSAYTLHGSFSSSRIEDANSSCMEQSSSTPVENIRKEWPSTPADGDGKPVNKSQTLADEVTFEQHTRMARGDANLAEQSNEGVIHSGDKKESDKAVSGNASEKPPSLQSLDDDGDDGDDAPWDDAPPDEPPYQAPGEIPEHPDNEEDYGPHANPHAYDENGDLKEGWEFDEDEDDVPRRKR